MAEHYVSDDEQLEAIKKWWKANGSGIITGLVLGVVAVVGWQYWNSYRAGQAEKASLYFDALSTALTGEKADKAHEHAQVLLEEYPNTTYAAMASLMLAKLATDEGDNKMAAERLEWVLNHTDHDEIKVIAQLRLVRVLVAEGRLDDAEAQLAQIQNLSFTAEVEELKGDIYLAREDLVKARAAYEAAQAAAGFGGSELLQMKLDNLPAAEAQEG